MKGFALFAFLLALIVWPFVPQAQSLELMEAFGRYLALYQQGRYAEAIPNFNRSPIIARSPAKPRIHARF